MPVTSRPQAEYGLSLNSTDMVRGVLPAPSWIRVDRVVTLNASLVVKTIGRVTDDVLAETVQRFCAYIGYHK